MNTDARRVILFCVCAYVLALSAAAAVSVTPTTAPATAAQDRATLPFDADWRFLKEDAPGAEKPDFDDSAWRRLDVPHDWSIEGPFDRENRTGGAGAFLPAGVGWYRKHFTLPADAAGRRAFIDFDGVMANSDVWVNGFHLGRRPYGYVSFRYELTGHLTFGDDKPNVLAVRVDDSGQPASRWYAGAGIYRHVRLVLTDQVHLGHWSTFVTTPTLEAGKATVHVQSTVVNQSGAARRVGLQVLIFGRGSGNVWSADGVVDWRGGLTAVQTVEAGKAAEFQQDIPLKNPELWDLDHPNVLRAVVGVRADGKTLDEEEIPFGVREFHFDADTGFWLNGKNFKLKGVCLHHEASAFGAAVPLGAWERRLMALRQLGVNAIRTAHNPPAPEFLDLCDRMGFLVMDEMFDCWTVGKNRYDYHLYFNEWSKTDTRDTVRRDRNHPSIILYSAGNEIHDTPQAELAKGILKGLVDVFHENDPTRPVTQALFRPNASHDYTDGLADLLDVVGQNYREREILAAHRQKPTRKIVGTENGHDLNFWLALRDNPPYSGQFLWTGVDYLGESRGWPTVANGSGLLDRTGVPKPEAFQRQSWWGTEPMVHIARRVAPTPTSPTDPGYEPVPSRHPQVLFSDWTPRDAVAGHEETVEAYSNCGQVELLLNGRSLGSQPRPADDSPRVWKVPFEPGTLRAVASNDGKVVATHELRTAGKAAKLRLTPDRTTLAPEWDDVCYVSAEVVDADGVLVPGAGDLITFEATGPGAVVAVDSADNKSHEPFQAKQRHAYQGRCFAILKATGRAGGGGEIKLTAAAPGLEGDAIAIGAGGKR